MGMQVGVRVEEEEVQTGARHHCCSAYLTFVAIRAGCVSPSISPLKFVLKQSWTGMSLHYQVGQGPSNPPEMSGTNPKFAEQSLLD